MIIHKIKMINFRCFQNKTIDFENKSVVLLSAANGIGKTTTIDAIEWCLTGNIGRLKTTFDTRSTNEADRRMNTDGILKNRNAKSKENIIVSLWLYDGEKERILCRRQKKDELNSEFSKVTLDENEEMAKIFIREYVGNSFYNFHFCDVQKSFNVQNKKRKELKDFFGEFITNYDEQKQIAENLDIFAEDVERYIEDKTKQKVSQDLIKNQEEEFAKTCEEAKKIPYPATIFYPNEKIEIVELNKAELTEQKKEVENCGYLIVEERLFKLIKNEALKNQQKLVVENEEKTLELKSSNLKILKDEIQPYFSEVKELQKTRKEINAENLTAEMAKELLAGVEEQLLGECKEQEIKEGYQQILTVLGYKFENETVQQTYEKVKNIIKKSYVVSSFSYDIFVSKLNAIDSILANKTLSDLRKKIEENTEKNKILDTEIEELQELKDIASQRAKDIRDAVEKLSQDEYKRVGPALGKFYNKLARFNSNEGINIIPEKEGISLVDNNGKNIVNILSNGQISVFMLAHFFASINVRNDREKMKIYFIDDLTACMDDVNMLAFMDLLKYQMSSKATMEQLFFATCDNRISNLLKYKLDGRGIEFCELLESDFE